MIPIHGWTPLINPKCLSVSSGPTVFSVLGIFIRDNVGSCVGINKEIQEPRRARGMTARGWTAHLSLLLGRKALKLQWTAEPRQPDQPR